MRSTILPRSKTNSSKLSNEPTWANSMGTNSGPEETILFMYGPDAEKLFSTVESVLRNYRLCQGARVVIRHGEPGSSQREFIL